MVTALLITLSLGQAWGVGTYSGLPCRAQVFGVPTISRICMDPTYMRCRPPAP